MVEYVCGFLREKGLAHATIGPEFDLVFLLRKEHPEWQRGLLNGVGGAVEVGENLRAAMDREWAEETGLEEQLPWKIFASLDFSNGARCHFFKADGVIPAALIGKENDAGERFTQMIVRDACRDKTIVRNLRWLLPLAFCDDDLVAVMTMP